VSEEVRLFIRIGCFVLFRNIRNESEYIRNYFA
jgi:hypothetical protein